MEPLQRYVKVAVEGPTDEAAIRRLLVEVGLCCSGVFGRNGKPELVEKIPAYNRAALFEPWVVLLDLDQDADCAPAHKDGLLREPSPGMHLRIAVRAVEAWLLADRERASRFLGVSPALVPTDPDMEPDPKAKVVQLARKSRRRDVRRSLVPREGTKARTGPAYTSMVSEFLADAQNGWRPEIASQHSPSLLRCIDALRRLASGADGPQATGGERSEAARTRGWPSGDGGPCRPGRQGGDGRTADPPSSTFWFFCARNWLSKPSARGPTTDAAGRPLAG